MNDLINISKINKLEPQKGRLLIAEPFMLDGFFKKSIIFLCEHNEEGSLGFVLNDPIQKNLSKLMEQITAPGYTVRLGGPVKADNLYFLHTLGNKVKGSIEVSQGIFMGGDFEDLASLINKGMVIKDEIRFFMGYSGWEAGQLAEEMRINSWLVTEPKPKHVMKYSFSLWKDLLDGMGGRFKMLSGFPDDPSLN